MLKLYLLNNKFEKKFFKIDSNCAFAAKEKTKYFNF